MNIISHKYKEKDKFLAFVQQEATKGLVDIKFFPKNVSDSTSETFFAEANRLLASENIPDNEIF